MSKDESKYITSNGITVSLDRIIRAVASSTVIETGEDVGAIENRLKHGNRRFYNITLCNK